MDGLRLHWLGHPQVEWKGRAVKLETRKATALLAYLSLNPGGCLREKLSALFWGEASQTKALANLRRALASLNARLPGWLEADRETLSLKRSVKLWVDVEAFHHLLLQLQQHQHAENQVCKGCLSILQEAAGLYRGDFLEGLNLGDSPAFDEWQFFERDGLRAEYGEVLERLANGYGERGEWEHALGNARRWVGLDRLNEKAWRALMDFYYRSGQKAAALHQYEELERLVGEQVGQGVETATRELYERIQGKEAEQPAHKAAEGISSQPLLKTKLYIPSSPSARVDRSGLLERLGEVEHRALTLISAPAGFGKTTLLAEWIAGSAMPMAWLSLDSGDNDPYRFLGYLVASLEGVQEGVGQEVMQMLRSPQLMAPHILLASLINNLTRVPEPFVLVLDDYQFINEHAVHEALVYLLDHLPSNMHIVIATRSDPPLQLGRLRANNQILELRMQDLRFTPPEAAEFLNRVMRLGLAEEDIEVLDARTEGWVVGLKMAALSIQGRKDVDAFIRAFSGTHRYVLDYLVEEVLKRQPAHIQTFLLETSILEKLNGPLCEALMSQEWRQAGQSGEAVLEYLEGSNLFLIPLDDQRQWYRYHHLFADLLLSRLQQASPAKISMLSLQAAGWFERNGFYPEAVAQLLLARDYQQAAGLIERSTMGLLANNELSTYLSWLDLMPVEVVRGHPWLTIYRAWIFSRLGRLDEVEPLLQVAEDCIETFHDTTGRQEMAGCIALVRANVANLHGDISSALDQTKKARGSISKDNVVARDNVDFQLGYAYYASGDFLKSRETWLQTVQSALDRKDYHTFANVNAELANLDKLQGELHQAFQTCQNARQWLLEHCHRPLIFTGVLEIGMADSLREWNQLSEANLLVQDGIRHAREAGRPNTLCFGYFVQSRILQALNDTGGVAAAINGAEQVLAGHTLYPRSAGQLATTKIRFWLGQGNFEAAFRWAKDQQLDLLGSTGFLYELEQIALSRVFIARGWMDKASKLLLRLEKAAEDGGRMGRLIEILILHAIAVCGQGGGAQAQSILLKSLSLAEEQGYIRSFVDEGESMTRLLKSLSESRLPPRVGEYVKRLLEVSLPS